MIFVATNMTGNVPRSYQKHPKHGPLKTPPTRLDSLSEISVYVTEDDVTYCQKYVVCCHECSWRCPQITIKTPGLLLQLPVKRKTRHFSGLIKNYEIRAHFKGLTTNKSICSWWDLIIDLRTSCIYVCKSFGRQESFPIVRSEPVKTVSSLKFIKRCVIVIQQ